MTKKITSTFGALLALALCSCDGPVEKAIDCARICDEAQECVGGDFDEKECRDECADDADQDAVDACESCLKDQDSCSENLKCTAECAGVLGAVVFQ